MTEQEYIDLAEAGKFDEIESYIRNNTDLSSDEKNELLYELEISRQEMEFDATKEEAYQATKYSNLVTTKTDIIINGKETTITDKNGNQIGTAIDGSEKLLLDLYSTRVYESLGKPLLDEKLRLFEVIRQFGFISGGYKYTGMINGRKIEFYPIGNNREIRAYAVTLTSPDSQDLRIILNTADDMALYFSGLQETFPTT